ncbi:hypothetical protein BHE74_00007562 [Ensete ventricosum]|nr:hypothetical protein BHE74_00007562 [Ensete ventricosum]RZS18925.1 hypothetical protein BHM03_00051256 [Ensete ventricosum]
METRDRAKKMAEGTRGRELGLKLEFRQAPFEGIETEGKGRERNESIIVQGHGQNLTLSEQIRLLLHGNSRSSKEDG